ncbi:MAG: helix-turn-helix transcriptional regulator [Magnetococcales bacterium]|nr:helix-turn-helix transcriptional regulator [Magnetococcales bacterium]
MQAKKTKGNTDDRYQAKWKLIRSLYQRGYDRQKVIDLFRFGGGKARDILQGGEGTEGAGGQWRTVMTFGERIVTAHKQAKLTQKELADRVGISQTAVHKLECSRSKSSRRTMTIALTCGVDPIWLETGQGEMALVGGLPGMTPKDP